MAEVVYFLSDGGELIKVGRTKSLDFRVATLQRESAKQIVLIGTKDGGSRLEAQIHRQLKEYRVHGEWFRDCEEVRSVVDGYVNGDLVEEQPLRGLSSHEPFTFSFKFDPAKLESDLATLALIRAERKSLEGQLDSAIKRIERLLVGMPAGEDRRQLTAALAEARAAAADRVVDTPLI